MSRGRRLASWAVGGAVLAVGLAAAVDVLVSGRPSERPGSPAIPGRVALAARLEAAGIRGLLYYSDAACSLRALRLPSLLQVPAPPARACAFALAPPGLRRSGWFVWRRPGALAATCTHEGSIEVVPDRGGPVSFIGGCAPAWRPNGNLTFVRRGEIVQFPEHGRAETILTRGQLAAALETAWGARELVWLGGRRLALVVAGSSGRDALAVFAGDRLVGATPFDGPLARPRPSPDGRLLAVLRGGEKRLLVLDAHLRPSALSGRVVPVRAAAWSPDGRWLAVLDDRGVALFRTGSAGPPTLRLPLAGFDVAWQAG